MRLDADAARRPSRSWASGSAWGALELAASIVEIANENMASAIKMVSLERGHDPRRFALLAFGGAGPLHAAAVARLLDIPRVIVPLYPGVFSALGLLLADIRVDKVWTQAFRSNDIDAALVKRQLADHASARSASCAQEGFAGEPELRRSISMRYLGQNYEHEVEIEDGELDDAALERSFRRFDALHAARYGYQIEDEVIELVSFKVSAIGPRPDTRPQPRGRDDPVPARRPRGLFARERLRRPRRSCAAPRSSPASRSQARRSSRRTARPPSSSRACRSSSSLAIDTAPRCCSLRTAGVGAP